MTDRPALPYDWALVRRALQDNLWPLLDRLGLRNELGGNARGDGQRIYPRNPTRDDRKPGSFVIWTSAAAPGAWKDYALGEAHKGDILDLIAYVEHLAAPIDVYWWALDFLNWERRGHGDQPRTKAAEIQERERRAAEQLAAEARLKADATEKSAALFKRWLGLRPIDGTPAETYLRTARGLPLDRLKEIPRALRWADSWEHIDAETGEVKTWRNLMVSALTRGRTVAALHMTFVKPDGSDKAGKRAKLILGPPNGAAIRLTKGPTGLNPREAAAAGRRGPLAVGEGIETSLSVACARPDYRVWSAGTLPLGMRKLEWPDCASAVVLLRDNDLHPQAIRDFEAVEAHWQAQAQGRPVAVAASAVGSDFNDWARKSA